MLAAHFHTVFYSGRRRDGRLDQVRKSRISESAVVWAGPKATRTLSFFFLTFLRTFAQPDSFCTQARQTVSGPHVEKGAAKAWADQ